MSTFKSMSLYFLLYFSVFRYFLSVSHDFGSDIAHFKVVFFKKFWRTQVLFVGSLIPLFWTSGDVFCRLQRQSWQPFMLGRGIHVTHSLRFTSGVTPPGG